MITEDFRSRAMENNFIVQFLLRRKKELTDDLNEFRRERQNMVRKIQKYEMRISELKSKEFKRAVVTLSHTSV